MNNISDNELVMLALEENEEAKNELVERYRYIIDIILRKYNKVIYQLGMDVRDLYSEGLYGFSDALVSFSQDKDTSVATFITLCVDRRIRQQLQKAGSTKNKINNEAFSLDYMYAEFGLSLKEIISDNHKYDPLSNITIDESYRELINDIKKELSAFEYTVFTFMANNFDYMQIAEILGKTPKQVDNTMQRLKVKVKKILEKRKNA